MTKAPIPPDLAEPMDQHPHYVRSVVEMADENAVVAHDDIYASNGMKLLARGASVDRSQLDLLSRHKLRAPLDLALSAENQVDAVQLAFEANRLIATDSAMARLAERSGDPLGFRQSLGALRLPEPVAFRLTVMRDMRGSLFQHTLRIALITYALAVRMGVPKRDMHDLLLAALCHDLGEMHTDPELLAPGHRIAADERRFVHVHPVTAYVLLCDVPEISTGTLQAVLQHHERLDGSGYPAGLAGDSIHSFARILCVAEVTDGLVRRADAQRVDVLLRLNHQRFDAEVIAALRELLLTGPRTGGEAAHIDPTAQLKQLAELLDAWPGLLARLDGHPSGAQELRFIEERMSMLRALVHNSGISPEYLDALMDIIRDDPAVATELAATLDELRWLMVDIANEIERRTASLDDEAGRIVGELVALLRAAKP